MLLTVDFNLSLCPQRELRSAVTCEPREYHVKRREVHRSAAPLALDLDLLDFQDFLEDILTVCQTLLRYKCEKFPKTEHSYVPIESSDRNTDVGVNWILADIYRAGMKRLIANQIMEELKQDLEEIYSLE